MRQLLTLFAVLNFSTTAVGAEFIGDIEFTDLLVSPSFSYNEDRTGTFDIDNAYIGFGWKKSELLSAQLKVGSQAMINFPKRYSSQESGLGILEAYVQSNGGYGRARLGMLPVTYGLESGGREAELNFNRSLIFQNGLLVVRDLGFSYFVANREFYTVSTIHHGEGSANLDNQLWFTTVLGWKGKRGLHVGFSGTTGRTRVPSTNANGTSSSTSAGIDVNKSSKTRIGNFFTAVDYGKVALATEFNIGEVFQDQFEQQIVGGHFDIMLDLAPKVALHLRYDHLNEDLHRTGFLTEEYSLGIVISSKHGSSTLYIWGVKTESPSTTHGEHRLILNWQLTPLIPGA